MTDSVARGVATRRIRRRARIWREWQYPDPTTLRNLVEQLREAARPRLYYHQRPELTATQLRERVAEAKAGTVQHLRANLRELRRASPYMYPYYREQVIKWLGNLRRWPAAEEALLVVSRELVP